MYSGHGLVLNIEEVFVLLIPVGSAGRVSILG